MEGFVLNWCQTTDFASGKIVDKEDNWYSVTGRDVEPDSIGRIFLVVGEPVRFRSITRNKNKSGTKTYKHATDIERPKKENNIDPKTHRELCLVKDSNWLVRQLGGLLTVCYGDLDGIAPKSIVSCGVKQDIGRVTWRATNIKFIAESEAEVDWTKAEATIHA
jgi:hypothetical protein